MIPQELKKHPFWCVRKNKIPYNPQTGQKAKPNQAATFGTYKEACAVVDQYDGLGVLVKDGLSAVDIDNCYDGKLSPLAAEVIDYFGSYAEYSPSGKGIRIIFRSPNPITYDKDRYYTKNSKQGLELYLSGIDTRYVTVTGDTLNGFETVRTLTEREILNFAEKHMKRPKAAEKPAPAPVGLSTKEILDKASRARNGQSFDALFGGQWEGRYQSHSEADQAFCNMLAFWCGRDKAQMDVIFRASGLYRPKWEREDYRNETLEKAVRACRETYAESQYRNRNSESTEPQEIKERKIPKLETISAVDLQAKKLPPVRFIVEGLLPQGLALLASPPKYGKSWFVLDLCLSVAAGRNFLNHKSNGGGCLYLALEDSYNRLKSRMNKVLQGATAPKGFDFSVKAPGIGEGLIETLEAYMKDKPKTVLIVIDTLQKVRTTVNAKEGAYQADYREVGTLKAFADKYSICILLVHHLRKAADDSDPFNRISGTNGIAGSADTSMVMARKSRSDKNTTLCVTGRDVESSDTVIWFRSDTYRWEYIGSLEEQEREAQRREYEENPLVLTLRRLLKEEGIWRGTAQELLVAISQETGFCTDSSRSLSSKIKNISHMLLAYDGIYYEAPTNHKRVHTFFRKTATTATTATAKEKPLIEASQ